MESSFLSQHQPMPFGGRNGSPNSSAVSIQRRIASWMFFQGSFGRVAMGHAPGQFWNFATKTSSSALQYR